MSILVTDLQRSAAAYQQLFGLPALRTLLPPGSQAYGLHFNGHFISLTLGPKRGLIHHICIGVDDFQPRRDGDALRAAGFDVRGSSDETLFVRDPDGLDMEISDTNYTGVCAYCPPPPAGAIRPAKGKTPVGRASTLNHFNIRVSNLQRAAAFYRKLFGLPGLRPLYPARVGTTIAGTHGLDFNDGRGNNYYISLSQQPAQAQVGMIDHFCVGVDNFEAQRDAEKVTAAGWKVRENSPGCVGCLFTNDPNGLSVQIKSPSGPPLAPLAIPNPMTAPRAVRLSCRVRIVFCTVRQARGSYGDRCGAAGQAADDGYAHYPRFSACRREH